MPRSLSRTKKRSADSHNRMEGIPLSCHLSPFSAFHEEPRRKRPESAPDDQRSWLLATLTRLPPLRLLKKTAQTHHGILSTDGPHAS
jgi:hypothetical protein